MSDDGVGSDRSSGARGRAGGLLARVTAHGGFAVVALAASALALAVIETAVPAVLGRALDAVVGTASAVWLAWAVALVVALVVCDALDDITAGAATARSTAWLRRAMAESVLDAGPTATDAFEPGDLVSRCTANAAETGRVSRDLVRAVTSLIPSLGGAVALALIDPVLFVTFAAGLPLLLVLMRAFAREATDAAARYLEIQGEIAGRLADALRGARTIAAAGTARQERDRVLAPLPALHRHGLAMWRAQMRISAQEALLAPLLQLAVLGVAGTRLVNGELTLGETLAAVEYVALAATVGSVSTTIARTARARAAAARSAAVLELSATNGGTATLPAGPGRLELRGVTVRIDGRAVLDGLDLDVAGGSMVAVVGRSSAGKSLVAALIGRLVDPDEGDVLIDGTPVTALTPADLRRAVGYAFERPVLVGATIGDAIAFGRDMATREEVVDAARLALADGFIRRTPQGYDSARSATPMSGGEVQRLGLARLFAHAGRVLVLDDVAASLDTITEHEIGKVLTEAMAGRTRVVVAHRVSTARRADAVAWIDQGRVRAFGPHWLLWADPEYRAVLTGGAVVPAALITTARNPWDCGVCVADRSPAALAPGTIGSGT